jgi:transposase
METMDTDGGRKERGLEIAARSRIEHSPEGAWFVPAQSKTGRYTVIMSAARGGRCTCPDYETRGLDCKHVHAVRFVMEREQGANGETTVTKSVTVTETVRRTYPQAWSAYNKAQTTEKDQFQILLADLCRGITEPDAAPTGRPRLPLADVIFAATFKVYSTVSGRRFTSDLRQAHAHGYTRTLPHYNSIFRYLENAALTPLLRDLIVRSSLPLRAIETDFAADSTGFMTSRFTRWFDHKYGAARQRHDWVKAHVMVGVRTHVVTAVEIHDRNAADVTQLPALVATTGKNFAMAEVSADKGYASAHNTEVVKDAGAEPFIAFRTSDTGWSGGAWGKAFAYFLYHREEWLASYHKRSNVETTFSMIKRKFGDALRSKTNAAMINETLCKFLAHNLVVLIHEMYELGINPTAFGWDSPAPALELPA